MLEFLDDPKLVIIIIPSVLVALNSMLKKLGMPDRWCPLINFAGGFVALPFLLEFGLGIAFSILVSAMIGLSAGGFYDFTKKTVRGE